MLKNNKGVTLVILIITVVVMAIIAGISTQGGLNAANSTKYFNCLSQIKVLQAKVNTMYEDYVSADEQTKKEFENYGLEISSTENSEQAKTAFTAVQKTNLSKENIGEYKDYRYYSADYIKDTLDLDGIEYDFIVNIKTRTVILVEGIEREGNIYYALCQIEGEQYNVPYDNE